MGREFGENPGTPHLFCVLFFNAPEKALARGVETLVSLRMAGRLRPLLHLCWPRWEAKASTPAQADLPVVSLFADRCFFRYPRSCFPSERLGRISNLSGKASSPTGHPVRSRIRRWTTPSSLRFLGRNSSQPCISDGSGSTLTMRSALPLERVALLLGNRCGVPRF